MAVKMHLVAIKSVLIRGEKLYLLNRFLFGFLVAFFISGAAYGEAEMTVSRLYLINPDPNDVSNSIDAIEAAVKTMDISPSRQVGLMPSVLPDKPGEIENQQMHFGPMTFNVRGCGGASYAQVGTQSSFGNALGSQSDITFGCLYLSKDAIRMAIVFEQKSASGNSLTGWISSGIKHAVRGNDKEYANKIFNKMIDAVREKVPNVLVELEEVPGEVIKPDQEKVALLFQKTQASAAISSSVAVPSSSNPTSPAQSSAAQVLPAPSGITQVAPTQPAEQQANSGLSDSERRMALLEKIADLKKSGVLTDQEFEIEKKKILGN